ncbi:protein N-terminal asparagine amidohydrolase-like protein [Camelus ferus]|nr:protein N-terminal asparagine amidohydrolase-like protein [Camelus ferus]
MLRKQQLKLVEQMPRKDCLTCKYQLVFCYTLIERNNRQMLPVIRNTAGGDSVQTCTNPLDTFFPFDPCVLKRSKKFIDPVYQVWEDMSAEELQEFKKPIKKEVVEDEEDDFLKGSISILGSDDATTCHIVVLRHTGNGATCLTHCDGTDTKAEVPLIMNAIKSFSHHAQCGRWLGLQVTGLDSAAGPTRSSQSTVVIDPRLEVHLVGGFSDDRQLSQKLTHQLLRKLCHTLSEEMVHFPCGAALGVDPGLTWSSSGLTCFRCQFEAILSSLTAVNVKTAEIYRASFQDRGPEEELRAARALTGGPMISIYDAKTEQLRIGPYSWMPFPHVDFWLQQDDKQILEGQCLLVGCHWQTPFSCCVTWG